MPSSTSSVACFCAWSASRTKAATSATGALAGSALMVAFAAAEPIARRLGASRARASAGAPSAWIHHTPPG
ncbi:MAG: hypothetical protein QM820_16590 [Minicystis sp.]